MENLSQLAKLRSLNLSFNRITKIEGIQNLHLLEVLELGKNYISDADALQSNMNKFCHLQELYIYMNQIRTLPQKMSFPMLKLLNVNRNQDLGSLSLDYCPFLEQISASYCSLTSLGDLSGSPNLVQVDISFNKLATLESVVGSLFTNTKVRSLVLNDNEFNFNVPPEWQDYYSIHFHKLLPALTKFNSLTLVPKPLRPSSSSAYNNTKFGIYKYQRDLCINFKNYVSKVMSQKIRVTFESTTN